MKWAYLKCPNLCLPEAIALVEAQNTLPNTVTGMSE